MRHAIGSAGDGQIEQTVVVEIDPADIAESGISKRSVDVREMSAAVIMVDAGGGEVGVEIRSPAVYGEIQESVAVIISPAHIRLDEGRETRIHRGEGPVAVVVIKENSSDI